MNESRLLKTLTLQYGRIGLANDFVISRKEYSQISSVYGLQHCPTIEINSHNILRLRLEVYQFLINFKFLNELVNWYNALVTSIDASLDISVREMPKFNNVPSRRRRRRRVRNNNGHRGRSQRIRSRALSSASELLSRSRRGTVTSNSDIGSAIASPRHGRYASTVRDSLFSPPTGGGLLTAEAKLQQTHKIRG